jgi:hypothetical protein
MTPDHISLASAIMTGELDDQLDRIIETIQLRRKTIRETRKAINSMSATVGQKVKLADNLRPKYLAGVSGTITKLEGNTLLVELPYAMGRYGKNVRVPADLVTFVD